MFRCSRASDTPREALLCPKRRPPHPQHPIVSVFRRGGLHFGRHTASNLDLTATKQGELRCERCTVELGLRRGRHQTGGIAPIEARHAGDTPATRRGEASNAAKPPPLPLVYASSLVQDCPARPCWASGTVSTAGVATNLGEPRWRGGDGLGRGGQGGAGRDEPWRASLARGLVGEFRDDACRR